MEHYLPGDKALMVLRFLAASGCQKTVISMIEEMPFIKSYISSQPPGSSTLEYLQLLAAPSMSITFSDLLSDYARAKLLVSQIIQRQNPTGSPIRQCDSLVTQLKQLKDVINNDKRCTKTVSTSTSTASEPQTPCHCLAQSQVVKVDIGVNTQIHTSPSEEHPNGADVPIRREMTSIETQTETESESELFEESEEQESEVAVADVPVKFCHSLLADTTSQQKIATAINEQRLVSGSTSDALQKVCSQTDAEVDRFLLDLFRNDDSTNSSGSGSLSKMWRNATLQQNIFDQGLTNIFGDSDNAANKNGLLEWESVASPKRKSEEPEEPSASFTNSVFPVISDTDSPQSSSMIRSLSAPIKRIMPQPAPLGTPRPHPVFALEEPSNQSVVPDLESGRPYTIFGSTVVPAKSDWEKLRRRPIEPKTGSAEITSDLSTPENSMIVQPIRPPDSSKISTNKRKMKLVTPVKANNPGTSFHYNVHHEPEISVQGVTLTTELEPPHQQRQACTSTPSYEDIPKVILVTAPISPAKPTSFLDKRPSSCQTPTDKSEENKQIMLNSFLEVTPNLVDSDPPETLESTSKTTKSTNTKSPWLRGLVASARKIHHRATTTRMNLNRKSFSTPRKKHVRSLLFNTPPSLKKADKQQWQPPCSTPSSLKNVHRVSHSLPRKRKEPSPDDFSIALQSKSKKRLHWSEDGSYKSSAFPDRNFSSPQIEENIMKAVKKIVFPVHVSNDNSTNEQALQTSAQAQPNLSNIAEVTEELESSFEVSSSREVSATDNPESSHAKDSSEIFSDEGNLDTSGANDVDSSVSVPQPVSTSTNVKCSAALTPIPDDLIYVTPPTPTVEVEVITSPVIEIEAISPIKLTKSKNSQKSYEIVDKVTHNKLRPTKLRPKKANTELISELFGTETSSSSEESRHSSPTRKKVERKKTTKNKNPCSLVSPSSTPGPSRRSPRVANNQQAMKSAAERLTPSVPISRPQVEITPPTPVVVTRKSKSPSISTPVARSRKSRCSDVIAARTVADSAVPLGRPSLSPKKNVKQRDNSIQNKSRIKQLVLPMPPNTTPTNASLNDSSNTTQCGLSLTYPTDVMTIHSVNVTQATPGKESFLPFNIIPAPMGFPDPTPVKNSRDGQSGSGTQFCTLITPMKSSTLNISPPSLSLPPTPRYLPELDCISNSNFSMFRSIDDQLFQTSLNTPFKQGPPPTPGRTIFIDEKSQGSISITTLRLPQSKTLTVGVSGEANSGAILPVVTEKPLDLFSPIPPHRMPHPNIETVAESNKQPQQEEIPPHVSISRNTPTVIVGKPNVGRLQLTASITPQPQLPRDETSIDDAPVKFQIPKDYHIPRKISPSITNLMPSKGSIVSNPGTVPFYLNGRRQFLVMTEEVKILNSNDSNYKLVEAKAPATCPEPKKLAPAPPTAVAKAFTEDMINLLLKNLHNKPSTSLQN